jgi:hypothetical protein
VIQDKGQSIYVTFKNSFMHYSSRDSSVSIVTRLRAGQPGFDSWQEQGCFLLATASRPALGTTQPPIQWIQRALSLGVNQSGREADHLPPSSAEVKNPRSYTSNPPYVFMA